MLTAIDIPLWADLGEMMVRSPKGLRAHTRLLNPRAWKPSSLVTRILIGFLKNIFANIIDFRQIFYKFAPPFKD
jgi:hypothetical protein